MRSESSDALQRTKHFLRVLDAFCCCGKVLRVDVEYGSRTESEEDGTNERGNDDDYGIARCRWTLTGWKDSSEGPGGHGKLNRWYLPTSSFQQGGG